MFPSLPPRPRRRPPRPPPLPPSFSVVQEGKLDEYRSYHDNIWPEVAAGLRAAGITQLTIFMVCACAPYVCECVCVCLSLSLRVCVCFCVYVGVVGVFVSVCCGPLLISCYNARLVDTMWCCIWDGIGGTVM